LWVINPVCYIIEKKKIKDAWTETKRFTQCRRESLDTGLREFINAWTNPTAAATFLLTPQFLGSYRNYVDALAGQGRRLPDDIQRMLAALVQRGIVPFSLVDIQNTRWLNDSDEAVKPLSPRQLGIKDVLAIVHGSLIVITPEMAAARNCKRIALWAHEVTHVYQNRILGANAFTARYLSEARNGYENISFERQAHAVEDSVSSPPICDLMGFPPVLPRPPLTIVCSAATIKSNSSQYFQFRRVGSDCGSDHNAIWKLRCQDRFSNRRDVWPPGLSRRFFCSVGSCNVI
jgi:hypothetical protein